MIKETNRNLYWSHNYSNFAYKWEDYTELKLFKSGFLADLYFYRLLECINMLKPKLAKYFTFEFYKNCSWVSRGFK